MPRPPVCLALRCTLPLYSRTAQGVNKCSHLARAVGGDGQLVRTAPISQYRTFWTVTVVWPFSDVPMLVRGQTRRTRTKSSRKDLLIPPSLSLLIPPGVVISPRSRWYLRCFVTISSLSLSFSPSLSPSSPLGRPHFLSAPGGGERAKSSWSPRATYCVVFSPSAPPVRAIQVGTWYGW